jgi:hypothetical protein
MRSATAFGGGTLIDGTGAAPRRDATVVVRDGRIKHAVSALPRSSAVVEQPGKARFGLVEPERSTRYSVRRWTRRLGDRSFALL